MFRPGRVGRGGPSGVGGYGAGCSEDRRWKGGMENKGYRGAAARVERLKCVRFLVIAAIATQVVDWYLLSLTRLLFSQRV